MAFYTHTIKPSVNIAYFFLIFILLKFLHFLIDSSFVDFCSFVLEISDSLTSWEDEVDGKIQEERTVWDLKIIKTVSEKI